MFSYYLFFIINNYFFILGGGGGGGGAEARSDSLSFQRAEVVMLPGSSIILQSVKEMENKVYNVLIKWKLNNLKEKFKGKEI